MMSKKNNEELKKITNVTLNYLLKCGSQDITKEDREKTNKIIEQLMQK